MNNQAPVKIKFSKLSKPVGPALEIVSTERNTLLTIRVTRDNAEDTNVFTVKLRRSHNVTNGLWRVLGPAVDQLYAHVGVSSPDRWPRELWQLVVDRQKAPVLARDGWNAVATHGYKSANVAKGKRRAPPPQRVTVAEHGVWVAGVVHDDRVRFTLNVTITHKPSGLCLPAYAATIDAAVEAMKRLESATPGFAADAKMNGDTLMGRDGVKAVVAAMNQAIVDGLIHEFIR